jgi:asparagine synthase (glutamine-hydrolysing)
MLDVLAPGADTECALHSSARLVWGRSAAQTGDQPLVNADGSKGVIVSGEIYNCQSIRRRLSGRPPLPTGSDAEVILALYEQRGPDGVRDLDGAFALALFDHRRDTFVLARDPLGLKPLFYGFRQGALYFTSEPAALALAGVEAVHEFPAGHYYTPLDGFIRYYRLPTVDKRPLLNAASIGLRIRRVLGRAVNRRVVGRPGLGLGAFCQGDLASALVAALAARQVAHLHTFAVGSRDEHGVLSADLQTGRLLAAHIGAQHHELVVGCREYEEALGPVIARLASYDPQLVRPAVAWFLVDRLAAEHVGVVLSGEGAEALFGGPATLPKRSPAGVNAACRRALAEVHLQGPERLASSFNLALRLPFLDKEMISLAMKIPAGLKINKPPPTGGPATWVFGQAFEGSPLLPAGLGPGALDRERLVGCNGLARTLAAEMVDEAELASLRGAHPGAHLDSREKALYFRIWQGLAA